MYDQIEAMLKGAPAWLTPELVIAAAGLAVALALLWLVLRLMRPRPDHARFDPAYYEEEVPPARPITPPPVTSAPVLMDEPPFAPPEPPILEREPKSATFAVVEPEPLPVAAEPEPAAPDYPLEPEPVEAVEPAAPADPNGWAPAPEPVTEPAPAAFEEAPEPAPFADEPIAAAAPFDASPASIAADVPDPMAQTPTPAPASTGPDDLTTMKGVGPRLAERLNSVGITSFAQIAALTPEDAQALDAKLGDFQGRIHKDRWIEQSTFLAAGDIAGFEASFGKL